MKNLGNNRLPPVRDHIVNLTLNLSLIAIVYVVLGAITASLIRLVFGRFNEAWTKQSLFYQLGDVSLELSFLVVVSFWITYFVHFAIPVLPVDARLEHFIELYGGRMVFVYAVFMFVSDLDDKMIHVYDRNTGDVHGPPSHAATKGY
jgi:hypothetical protein